MEPIDDRLIRVNSLIKSTEDQISLFEKQLESFSPSSSEAKLLEKGLEIFRKNLTNFLQVREEVRTKINKN